MKKFIYLIIFCFLFSVGTVGHDEIQCSLALDDGSGIASTVTDTILLKIYDENMDSVDYKLWTTTGDDSAGMTVNSFRDTLDRDYSVYKRLTAYFYVAYGNGAIKEVYEDWTHFLDRTVIKLDSLMWVSGWFPGAWSTNIWSADEDTSWYGVGNYTDTFFGVRYIHTGGSAGDEPDSTRAIVP